MAIGEEHIKTQPTNGPSSMDKGQGQMPYGSIVSQIVRKIRNEPFLFVIAVAGLLIGLALLAAKLGSPDARFIVVVIAVLAFTVILGYYVLAVLQQVARQPPERLQQVVPGQTLAIDRGTKPGQSVDPPKYVIDASSSTGVAIGDNPIVNQRVENPGQPLAPDTPLADVFTPEEHSTALQQQLSRHRRNLARLQAKKGVYAAGEEPLSIVNQIDAEEREIQRIEAELERHTRG